MSVTPVSIASSQAEEPRLFDAYRWMFLAVVLTVAISLAMVTLPLISSMVFGVIAPEIAGFVWLIVLELLLVGYLAPALSGRSASSRGSTFLTIAIMNGLIFSFVLTYAGRSIGETYLSTFYEGLAGGGWLWPHISATFKVVLYGFVFAVVLGVPLGIALGSSRSGQRIWQLALQAIYAVPKTMLYPIFIVLFGIGSLSRIAIAFSHALFPLMIGAVSGTAVRAPSLAPGLATAVRTALSLSVTGVVLSEMYVSTEGLGFLLMVSARERGGANRMLAVVLLLFLVLLVVNVGLRVIEKRLRARGEPDYTEKPNP
jgi:ABC-type nitrate/sulfonate/bicarbonate transport system permease component